MNPVSAPDAFGLGFPPPGIVGPRQHLFGVSEAESALTSPNLPDQFFAGRDEFETDEAKRRRIAKACDVCRKKKIKCDGLQPKCTHCVNYGTECVFTHVEKKRSPPKGAKYIEGLENKLQRMETLLRMSDLFEEGEDDNLDLATLEKKIEQRRKDLGSVSSPDVAQSERSNSYRPGSANIQSPLSQSIKSPHSASVGTPKLDNEKPAEVEELSDMLCSLVTNTRGESKFIGSSSGFSVFSPQGIAWVNEKTGDASFQELIANAKPDDRTMSDWRSDVFGDLFSRRVYQPLPPKMETLSLLEDFFQNFNCIFPLFHRPTFMRLVELQYSRTPYEGSGWWASLNVALAIAHRLRVMSQLVPKSEDDKGWGYLKNAAAVLTELAMRNTDLLSVQALLGMALFLLGSPNPQPSFFLVSAAIRTAHAIGLHKRGSTFNLNQDESEQRNRVFWIAYMLDKDVCLRTGRPPAQDDDDMNVDLPTEDPADNVGNIPLADGKGKANLFRMMCCIAVIEYKVYKRLYSARASRQTEGELLNAIGELDQELENWKESVPIDFRPEHEIRAAHAPLVLHVVVLHLTYYNCLSTIHRMSIQQGYWTSRLSDFAIQGLNMKPLNPRVFSSTAISVASARTTITLLKYIPQGDFPCVWMILYFPISALITLFANVLQNPTDPKARNDIKLMGKVVDFLTNIQQDEEESSVKRTLTVCAMFERISKVVVDKVDKDASARRKRKSHAGHDPNAPPSRSQAAATTIPPEMMANGLNNSVSPRLKLSSYSPPAANMHQFNLNGMGAPGGSPRHLGEMPNMTANYQMPKSEQDFLAQQYSSDLGSVALDPAFLSSIGSDTRSSGMDDQSYLTPLSFDDLQHDIQNNPIPDQGPEAIGYQQPFVPQDLWQMPMSFDFDWQDITAQYPHLDSLTGG